MSTQDLEQRARELLAAGWKRAGQHMIAAMVLNGHDDESTRVAIGAIADTLRQQPAAVECSCPHMDMNEPASNHGSSCPGRQPAPVDLEQFRFAVLS